MSKRTASEDLAVLARDGVNDQRLESCLGLAEMVLQEVRLPEPISAGDRIILLREVLTQVTSEARRQALEELEDHTLAEAAKQPAFQVAAAGELLRLTDEAAFVKVRDQRCDKLPAKWSDIERMEDNQGDVGKVQLRAAIWIGNRSGRSAAPDRHGPKLLAAVAAAIKVHAKKNQTSLRALVAQQSEPPHSHAAELTDAQASPHLDAESQPVGIDGLARKKFVWLAAAVALIGIGGAFILLNNDDPATGPTIQPSSTAPSSPPRLSVSPVSRLDQVPPCRSVPSDSPLANELRGKQQAIVDGRCDSDPDAPIRSYVGPSQSSEKRALLRTGDRINDICLTDTVVSLQDLAGHASSTWVRFKLGSGGLAFIPAIWVQGEEGAGRC